MARTSTRTPNTMPMVPGEYRAEPETRSTPSVSGMKQTPTGLLYGGEVAYLCPRWLWHWWRLNWRRWPWTHWCNRHQSHWRSDATPAGTLWRAPPCCMPSESASSTLHPESRCTPLLEGWRKKRPQWVRINNNMLLKNTLIKCSAAGFTFPDM